MLRILTGMGFVHSIDPIIGSVGGVHLWWYGLSYTLGFLEVHWFLLRARQRLGLSISDVQRLSLLFALGVLAGGRFVEVAFDEWPFYREHPGLIPALWLGGMATHGLLLGAAASVGVFAWRHGMSYRALADELVIPGAFLLGVGRIGNFIDGQIVGSVTSVPWGVLFPDAEGFRHPVVLYDGAKNLMLIPLLIWVRGPGRTEVRRYDDRVQPPAGRVAAHFVFWYAFLRLFVDLFRDYPTHRLAFGTGQTLNLVMTLVGVALIYRSYFRRPSTSLASGKAQATSTTWPRLAFAGLLIFCLTIPSNWTQDVPGRYGARHTGLRYSRLYPQIDTAAPGAAGVRSEAARLDAGTE